MKVKNSLRGLLLASTCLFPAAALAADGDAGATAAPPVPVFYSYDYADIGGGYVSTNSPVFNRYTGIADNHGFAIGDFLAHGRDAYDSGGTRYWSAEGHDLGLTSRSFTFDYGQQGSWGVQLYYQGIPYNASNHFVTIYDSSGHGTLNGGAPSVSSTPFWRADLLAPFLRTETNLGTQRDIFGGSGKYTGIPNWIFSTDLRHDHKEGDMEQSMIFGTGKNEGILGLTPGAGASSGNVVYFPMPIDYDTDRYEVKAQYSVPRFQGELRYVLSNFTDNNASFNAIDPFQSPSVFAGTTGAAGGNNLGPAGTLIQGVYSLPPSNQAHQVSGTLAYNFTPTTRLVATGSWGLQLQNESFVPATLDSFTASKVPTSTTFGSLQGQVQTLFGDATFTSRPFNRTDFRASYTVDSRDNQSPRQLIQAAYADAWHNYAQEIGTAAAALGVMPFIYKTTIQNGRVEAGYRIAPETKVTAGYLLKITDRTFSDVDHQIQNGFFTRVNTSIAPGVNGSLGWEYSNRSAGTYNGNYPWQALGYASNENKTNALTPGGSQPIVAFFEAARTENVFKARLTDVLNPDTEVGIEARYTLDHYPSTQFGLTDQHDLSIGPDFSYNPTPEIQTTGFYAFEQIYRNLTGGLPAVGTTWLGPWTEKTNDVVHTVSLEAHWKPANSKWRVSAGYNFQYGDVGYSLFDNVTQALINGLGGTNPTTLQQYIIQPFPNTTLQLHSFSLTAEYKVMDNLSLLGGYTFERLIYDDAGIAALSNPLQYSNALLPGDQNPSYAAHVVRIAARYRF